MQESRRQQRRSQWASATLISRVLTRVTYDKLRHTGHAEATAEEYSRNIKRRHDVRGLLRPPLSPAVGIEVPPVV